MTTLLILIAFAMGGAEQYYTDIVSGQKAKVIFSDPNVSENLVCFKTLSGDRAHLKLSCQYMYSKGNLREWRLCNCESICLACIARKIRDEE